MPARPSERQAQNPVTERPYVLPAAGFRWPRLSESVQIRSPRGQSRCLLRRRKGSKRVTGTTCLSWRRSRKRSSNGFRAPLVASQPVQSSCPGHPRGWRAIPALVGKPTGSARRLALSQSWVKLSGDSPTSLDRIVCPRYIAPDGGAALSQVVNALRLHERFGSPREFRIRVFRHPNSEDWRGSRQSKPSLRTIPTNAVTFIHCNHNIGMV